jgi:hypothetical protein
MASSKLLALAVILGLAACNSAKAPAPEGFAAYKGDKPFRAVSADGVVYRVRTESDASDAALDFWKEALKKRMLDAGYTFLRESDIKASEQPGYLLELTAPLGPRDYTYLIAIFKHGKRLVVVESSGEVSIFEKRRGAVLDAIAKLET